MVTCRSVKLSAKRCHGRDDMFAYDRVATKLHKGNVERRKPKRNNVMHARFSDAPFQEIVAARGGRDL